MENKAKLYAGAVPVFLALAWSIWGPNVGQYLPPMSTGLTNEVPNDTSNLKGHMERFGEQAQKYENLITLDYFPDPEVFYRDYVRKSVPLVVKGALKHWPAVQKWKNEDYLREKFGEDFFNVHWRNVSDEHHPAYIDMTMEDFLDTYRKEKIYMDSTVSPEMAEDLTFPGFVACEGMLKMLKQVAIFFNSGWSSTDIHLDVTETIFAQVTGGRHWILTTPRDGKYLYTDEFAPHNGISPVNQETVDLIKFPDVSKIVIYNITLEAGDIIYIPEGWFHQARTKGGAPNIAIAVFINFLLCMWECPDSDDAEYVENCIKLREQKPTELECNFRMEDLTVREVLDKYSYLVPPGMVQWNKKEELTPVLLKSGYNMPMLGLGLGGTSQENADRAIRHALKIGYRLFDTDPEGESEAVLGSILAQNPYRKREEIFVIVKVHPKDLGKYATKSSIERSMKRLKTDYIDLVLIKAPSCDTRGFECEADENRGTWQESWEALEELNRTGTVRSIGVSNFKISQIKELLKKAKAPLSVLQARFDLMKRNTKLRKFCDKHEIRFMAHSVLGFKLTEDGYSGESPLFNIEMVKTAARKYRTSPATVLLRYAMDRNVTVVPKSTNPLHISLNKHAFYIGVDSDPSYMEDMEELFPHVN
ncbi:uncharacterized protein LOC106171368 [Lingula anatina]|uniref:Uncharacterized protein LOC106171368 n=1 Tax=Lingula anatina TaxID=7574 RepID=A0A1S3JB75_LINAN|nr:uncharacterized protein LOC106171368 [Lingula anatina]|eukprot:XP_013407134.1 uncharacterized protein LOC106171368 [Lingula anatina]